MGGECVTKGRYKIDLINSRLIWSFGAKWGVIDVVTSLVTS